LPTELKLEKFPLSGVYPVHDGRALALPSEDGGDGFAASWAAKGEEGAPSAANALAGQKVRFDLRGKSEIKL